MLFFHLPVSTFIHKRIEKKNLLNRTVDKAEDFSKVLFHAWISVYNKKTETSCGNKAKAEVYLRLSLILGMPKRIQYRMSSIGNRE